MAQRARNLLLIQLPLLDTPVQRIERPGAECHEMCGTSERSERRDESFSKERRKIGLPRMSTTLPANGFQMAVVTLVDTAARLFAAEPISQGEGAATFRAAVNLFKRWELTDEQAATLLDLPMRTYARWKRGEAGRIDRDTRARLSNIMGIHKALRVIFHEAERGYRWIKAANDSFGGRSALDVMLGGELTDLMRVRRLLDAERGRSRAASAVRARAT